MTQLPEWREFEKLVSRIERAASPYGAEVKSPDRIRDLITGQMREVDAAIRTKLGTTEVLITVECRKRGRKSDDTWIEQLATKRQKIGAAKTIAVSSSGFTNSAIKTAEQHGIELRILSKVSASDIESWFLPNGAVHVFRLIEDIRCFVVLYDDSGEPSDYGFWAPNVEDPVFHHDMQKDPFPIKDYIPILEELRPQMFHNVPFDGTKVELEFPIQWNPGELWVAMTTGRMPVHLTKLVAAVSYQAAICETKAGIHHQYSSPEGIVVQHTAFDTELLGMPVTFEHQCDQSGQQKTTCEFKAKRANQEDAPDQKPVR